MSSQRCPSDLSDREWQCIQPLRPPAKPGGRPHMLEMHRGLNALFYLVRGGRAWSMLPREYPNRRGRRRVRDHAYLPHMSETMMYVAMTRPTLKRLGNAI
ncbi:MAG TPA: transposase [Chthonomonadales bacterium]|nr:transposase [Chthonomonadales bacterium]